MNLEDLSIPDQREYHEWADATAQQEFEQRKWPVQCVLCERNEVDTQKELEAKGWMLAREGEFCPTHNYRRQLFRARLMVSSPII